MNNEPNAIVAQGNNNNKTMARPARAQPVYKPQRHRLDAAIVDSYEYTADKSKHFRRRRIEDNNGIFSAFGMGRSEAAAMLLRHFSDIREFIQKAAKEALEKPQFIQYLRDRELLPKLQSQQTDPLASINIQQTPEEVALFKNDIERSVLTDKENEENATFSYEKLKIFKNEESEVADIDNYIKSLNDDIGDTYSIKMIFNEEGWNEPAPVSEVESEVIDVNALSERDDVLKAYINYDVLLGRVEMGNSSIQVIKALAQVQKVVLYLWAEQDNGKIAAHYENRNVFLYDILLGNAPKESQENINNQLHLLIGERNVFNRMTMQGNSLFIYPIPTMRDLGYQAFGLTRKEAYELLLKHKAEIKCFLKEPIKRALMKTNFVECLVDESFPEEKQERLHEKQKTLLSHLDFEQGKRAPLVFLESCEEDDDIIEVYLKYDVYEKGIEEGWSNYQVMMALGYLIDAKVVLWERNIKTVKDVGQLIHFNLVKSDIRLDTRRNAIILVRQGKAEEDRAEAEQERRKAGTLLEQNPVEINTTEIAYEQWLVEKQKTFARELHLFCGNNNKFERMEVLQEPEYLSDEHLVSLQDEKAISSRNSMAAGDKRDSFVKTTGDEFPLLCERIGRSKSIKLIEFYMETAVNAVENDLWLVLRYLLKDTTKRTKMELRLRREIQNCEEKSQRLSDRISLVKRQKKFLEYLYLKSASEGEPLDRLDKTNDALKIINIQKVLDKILSRTQKRLLKEFEHSATKEEQWLVDENLTVLSVSPSQKKQKYSQWLGSMRHKLTAEEMMCAHGFDASFKTLEDALQTMNSLSEFLSKKIQKYFGYLNARQEMLGDSMNDRLDPTDFLEPVDAFLNKYDDKLKKIIGKEFENEYEDIRRRGGQSLGNLVYEYLTKYPPAVICESFTIETYHDLLNLAVSKKKVFLARAMLLLEVDPTKANKYGQTPSDVAQEIRDVELSDMINQRIKLNQMMDDETLWETCLEEESELISRYKVYVDKHVPAQADRLNPQRAKLLGYTNTAYSHHSLFVSLYNTVNNKETFKNKLDYHVGIYKRCIVVDSTCFQPALRKIRASIEDNNNRKLQKNFGAIAEDLYKRLKYISGLRTEALDAVVNKNEMTLIDKKQAVIDHIKTNGGSIPFLSNLRAVDDNDVKVINEQLDEYGNIYGTYQFLQELVRAGASANHYEALIAYLENSVDRNFKNPSYHLVISKLCELTVEYRRSGEYQKNFDESQLSRSNLTRNELINKYNQPLENPGKWMAVPRTHNALFEAVAMFLNNQQNGTTYTSQGLRSMASKYMNSNRKEYDDHDEQAFNRHKQELSLDNMPIKNSDIQTLAFALKIQIFIKDVDDADKSVQGIPRGEKIYLKVVGEHHFDVLIPNTGSQHTNERVYSVSPNIRLHNISGQPSSSRGHTISPT